MERSRSKLLAKLQVILNFGDTIFRSSLPAHGTEEDHYQLRTTPWSAPVSLFLQLLPCLQPPHLLSDFSDFPKPRG